MERKRPFKEIDATAHFQKELDEKIKQLYPIITSPTDPNYQKFVSGEISFCSFPIYPHNELTNSLLLVSLERAANPEEEITYSTHGAEHKTFQEAIQALIKSIMSGKFSTWDQAQQRNFQLASGRTPLRYFRTIVDSSEFLRESFRPIPQVEAIKISQLPENEQEKNLRKLAYKYGPSFAILVAVYLCLDTRDILSIFDNKDVRDNIQKRFGKIKIPHPGLKKEQLEEQIDVIKRLMESLTYQTSQGRFPSYSSDDYRQALRILKENNFLPRELESLPACYSFSKTTDYARARAVFKSLHEIAQELANPNYNDPARTEYIDRTYKNFVSSRVITAFIQTINITF